MSDETSQAIFGDAVAASLEKPGRKKRSWLGRRHEEPARFTHCEDCGAELHGRYCSVCGQVAVDYHRSFRYVVADVAESFFNWDSKFTRTIGLLLLSPGWLTNQFVSGRRTRYLHPLRVYLLVSILFFLCVRFIPMKEISTSSGKMTPEKRAELEEVMSDPAIPQAVRKQVLNRVNEQEKAAATKPELTATPAPTLPPEPAAAGEKGQASRDDPDDTPKWLRERILQKVGPHGAKLDLFRQTLRDNISTMMLFCIPLFALVLKVLYLRQRRFYIEHLVYALHIHAFFYLAVLITAFAAMAAKWWVPVLETPLTLILVLAIFGQVFRSIRQVYRQGWAMTTFKFFFGGFVYLFVLLAALAATGVATLLLP